MSNQRLPKFRRVPEAVAGKRVTERGVDIIRVISRYRLISTSTLCRVVAGNADVTYRHLQQLYHQGFISRFTLPRRGNPGEFIYLLEDATLLRTVAHRFTPGELDWVQIKRNREKFGELSSASASSYGKFLFVRHELMISDFHASLEIACRESGGRVELERWFQGAELWDRVRMPTKQVLPHRPDAFFALRFPMASEGQQRSNFFYEADRDTSNATRLQQKLEAYFEYLRQGKQAALSIKRIRAILIETISTERKQQCLDIIGAFAEKEPFAAQLFWCSSALVLDDAFAGRWSTTADKSLRSLSD